MTNYNFEDQKYAEYMQDQTNENIGAGPDAKYLDFLTKTLCPDIDFNKMTILDLGCSAFNSWDYFKAGEKSTRKNPRPHMTGIDVSTIAEELCIKNKKRFHNVDAHKMESYFQPGSFDMVYSSHSFEHMLYLPKVLENCAYVLRPGGLLFYALPMPAFNWGRGHWYDVPNNEAMLEMLTQAGFENVFEELVRDLRFRPQQEMVGLSRKPV